MDFGVGFLSNNVMLPILDFFYGIVPSYGLAIIFLTLVVRFALYPINVSSIRNMRKMKVVNPVMQRRMREIQDRHRDDPQKLREAQAQLYSELGVNPLGGCLPLIIQMPVLLALFATLRGSPFAPVTFDANLQILPPDVAVEVAGPVTSDPKNVFLTETNHRPIVLVNPEGNKIPMGEVVQFQLQSEGGKPLNQLLEETQANRSILIPNWKVTKGEERVQIGPEGTLTALQPGDVTIQASIPGLASNTGFLFIDKLGQVGWRDADGTIHWDILGMVILFGLSTYVNTLLTGQGQGSGEDNPAQNSATKITPVLVTGMFLFFPLPAGVLLYIVVSSVFQTLQTYILSLESLPESLQQLVEEERQVTPPEKSAAVEDTKKSSTPKSATERKSLPFEP